MIIYYFKLSGILLILFGLWTIYYKQDYSALSNSILYEISIYTLMIGGTMCIIAGILGVVSAWIESKRLLIMVFLSLKTATKSILF